MLKVISTPFVFVLSFFTFTLIRLLALVFSPCYKYTAVIMYIWISHVTDQVIYQTFGFILYAANDCVYTSKQEIERRFVNFKN